MGRSQNYKIAYILLRRVYGSLSEESVYIPDDLDFKDGVSCNNAVDWLKNTVSSIIYLALNNTKMLRKMSELRIRDEVEVSQHKLKYFGKFKDYLYNFLPSSKLLRDIPDETRLLRMGLEIKA